MRTANYSDFLTSVSSLIGVDQATLQTLELTFLNTYFNKAIRKIWEASNWTDICPNGEARFPQNLITYPNDLSQVSTWSTLTGATITPNALANPLDGRTNVSLIQEDTSAGTHGVGCFFPNIPSSTYQISGYARPYTQNGDNYLFIEVTNSTDTGLFYFNLNNCTVTTSFSSSSTIQPSIWSQPMGFCKWSIQFSSSASSFVGNLGQLQLVATNSSSSVTSAGSTTRGIYSYGNTISNGAAMVPATNLIPWEQPGEAQIDVSFAIKSGNPGNSLPTSEAGTLLTPAGIQLLGPIGCGPMYLNYRYRRPSYTGNTLNLASGYASSTTVYYTTTLGAGNFYTTSTTTTPAQTPDTNPTSFTLLTIPYVFFEYCVYSSYGDWLEVEGQTGKAQAMREFAQTFIDDEHDRQERQQGNIMPWRVYTHVTSQNRGLGYLGSNYNPVGTILNPNS